MENVALSSSVLFHCESRTPFQSSSWYTLLTSSYIIETNFQPAPVSAASALPSIICLLIPVYSLPFAMPFIADLSDKILQILRLWYNLTYCSTWERLIQRVNEKLTFCPYTFLLWIYFPQTYGQPSRLHKKCVRFFTCPHYPQKFIHITPKVIHIPVCPF